MLRNPRIVYALLSIGEFDFAKLSNLSVIDILRESRRQRGHDVMHRIHPSGVLSCLIFLVDGEQALRLLSCWW